MNVRPRHRRGGTAPSAAAAFEPFFRDHYPGVLRLAYAVLGDVQRAQDVAQDVFLAAHQRFPEGPEHATGWLRVATVHTALNVLRGERRRARRHEQHDHQAGPGPSAEETVLDREARAEVRRALGRLPRRTAAVLVMRHSGMSYADLAAALGVKVGQIGTMLRRAESALCKEMDHASRP